MFSTISSILEEFKSGRPVIVVDDEDRENEGDFVCAAEKITPELVNFFCSHGRGLICTPLSEKKASELDLPLMVAQNTSVHTTAFTVSIDSKLCHTGISAHDRYLTINALINDETIPSDFTRPGHIFPLIARQGGVIERPGHTEAAIDFCKLAGLKEVGVICEIMNEDGSMARLPELIKIAEKFDLKIVSIKSLVAFLKNRSAVELLSSSSLPTSSGDFQVSVFSTQSKNEVVVMHTKNDHSPEIPMIRVHSECLTGDVFGSLRCDCGDQLKKSLEKISQYGHGMVIYLRQEGRGIGLANKVKAYKLQEEGFDTIDANVHLGFLPDERDYNDAAMIIKKYNYQKVKLITNNPKKIEELSAFGIDVVERVELHIHPNEHNFEYLKTKKERFGHFLFLQ
ncbi:MAG: bifunctional 3,4-dihydroxy-2-butanone 4-phosphate synthase/GTP cyclohydrolase II [Bdellovibrionales bacterium GWA2_49_15]|nr:MAG: bifunctional 3,4-dihydroxy-2-butanone 4-phosphate synthase/GTP cyclohydrolase II [Bdellovibrionales bacterium GWA2_49_15]